MQIEIRDTGPGIAADQMDKLFSPFVSTKKSRGTGLGLPVSQKILTEHGGKITVESLPGQGACFTLELPAVSPTTMTQIVPPASKMIARSKFCKVPCARDLLPTRGFPSSGYPNEKYISPKVTESLANFVQAC